MSSTTHTTLLPANARSGYAVRMLVLPVLVLLAASLRLWHLGEAGFGTEYYAAAVRSMQGDQHNLLYNAFDPAGILAVDKPPLALWMQVLSASLLGFGPFALMLPQAIEGSLSVAILWWLVRRDFGEVAGALAGLFLALTPISVAVDRSNNTDSLLVLVLLCAACALPRGGDRMAPLRLILAMALVGVAFNVKMLAAFGVLPAFAASYALTAGGSWARRIVHLAAGGVALAVVSGAWVGLVALTPPAERPFVDSSADNSILDLVVNHNAAQRFLPRAWRTQGIPAAAPAPAAGGERRFAGRVPPGPLRLADPGLASQVMWLLPLALAGAVALVRWRRREAACLWIGWAVAYALVFSFAGGLFSPYYLVMLAPPLAALGGIGVVALARMGGRWWIPAVLGAGIAWQAQIMRPVDWDSLRAGLLIAALAGVLLALVASTHGRRVGLAVGVAALLIAPSAWAVGTVMFEGGRPLARLAPEPNRFGRAANAESGELRALLPYLQNRGGTRFLAATANARLAAPLIIATGAPVIAFGGALGTMPVRDGAALAQLVASGELRFAVLGVDPRRRPVESDATRWIRAHGRLNVLAEPRRARFELYDLKPGGSE